LPGNLSQASAKLNGRSLKIEGGYSEAVDPFMKEIAKKIRKSFFAVGGLVLPGSFTVGRAGSDIHYAGTLPMSLTPSITQTSPQGELYGTKGIYIADGACLPYLPEKSHTLTIMANAARIGYELANIS
jgi:choline dehydrogenase-like flavoprotein